MKRIAQPSTWAGIAAFGQLLAQLVPQYAWVGTLVTGIGGAAAVALNEKGKVAAP